MQTSFSLAQLADPNIATADRILRACVHCGFCQATCPTYVLLGDELDSPRGRIYLIKEMLEHDAPATAEVVTHIDRCLSCLACMTTCPSGVHYMHLVDHARAHIEATYERPLLDRLMRLFLAHVMPYPRRLRLAMMAGVIGKPFAPLLTAVGLKPLAAAARLAPLRAPDAMTETGVYPANGLRKARVALLAGCANEALAPSITQATIRVLNRHGVEVVVAPDVGCCGSLEHHMGREAGALGKARANIDGWIREIEGEGLDAILITISGCGTTVKDYGFMLRTDPVYADKAAKVSGLARDISEYLAALGIVPPQKPSNLTVAFHSACSLQHGQRVHREPRDLLAACGFVVKDIPEAHLCCGSAGTYNIMQPDIAGRLRDRKIGNIEKTAPDIIAAGNIGCITQIASGTATPVVHVVELIDWATGGPMPEPLKGRLGGQEENHGKAAQGQKDEQKGREIEEACSGARKEGRIEASCGEKVGEAETPASEDQAAATRESTECIAADDAAGARGHADRAAAVAVPLVGAGRFADQFTRRQKLRPSIPPRWCAPPAGFGD